MTPSIYLKKPSIVEFLTKLENRKIQEREKQTYFVHVLAN